MRNDRKTKNLVIKVLLMMSLFFLSLVVLNINLSNVSKAEESNYIDIFDGGEWDDVDDETTYDKNGSALTSQNDAVSMGPETISHYEPGLRIAPGGKASIGFQELRDYAEILCCQRGQHISGGGSYTVDYSKVEEGADETKEEDELDPNSDAAQNYDHWDFDDNDEDDGFKYPNGTVFSYEETKSQYTAKDSKRCIPQEAWVLSALADGETPTSTGYYSMEQQAWWMTPAGHTGGDMGSNELYEEAVEFEKYIIAATESTKDGSKNNLDPGAITEQWNEYRRDPSIPYKVAGFNLSKPEWVTKGNIYNNADNGKENYKNPNVSFNAKTNEYLVGPFAIDYCDTKFSNITSIELVLDNNKPLVLEFGNKNDRKKDFKIVLYDAQNKKFVKTDKDAPGRKQGFYIIIGTEKVSNATAILQFNVNFEYKNADGTYQYLEGTYGKSRREVVYEYDAENSEGRTGTHATVQSIDGGTLKSQRLALAGDAYRWTEKYSLRRQFNIKIAQIQIIKEVQDEYGNTIDNKKLDEARFKFNIKVKPQDDAYRNHINANKPDKSVYRNNFENHDFPPLIVTVGKDEEARTAKSHVYAWSYEAVADDSKIKNPTYEITEVFDSETVSADKYHFIRADIVNDDGKRTTVPLGDDFIVKGELQTNRAINLYMVNQKLEKKYGYLRIQKTMKEPNADEGARNELSEQIKNKEFKFNVKITGDFYINGVHYTKNNPYTNPEGKPITIKADGDYHYVMVDEKGKEIPVVWYTKNAPEYELEELKDETGETKFSSDAKLTEDGRYIISGKLIGTTTTATGDDFKPEPDEKNLTNISSASFENEYESEGAKLRIIKQINLSSFTSKEARDYISEKIKKLSFTFRVTANGEEEDIVLQGGNGELVGDIYQITWVSKEYTWYKLDKREHLYKIKEINVPEGTSFVSFNGEAGKTEVSGSLKKDDNVLNEITNIAINKIDTENAKIKLEKTLGSVDNFDIVDGKYKDESKEILKDRDYYFYVDIKGSFSYGDNLKYGDHYIRLTKDGYVELKEDGKPVKEEDKDKYETGIVIKPSLEPDPNNPGKGRYVEGSNVLVLDKEIRWCEFDEAPDYTVSEDASKVELPDGYTLNSPTFTAQGSSGKLKPSTNNTFNITVNNTIGEYKYGKINLIKTLEGAENYKDSDIKDIEFKFHVKVIKRIKAKDANGNEIEVETDVKDMDDPISVFPTKEGDKWVWKWDSADKDIVIKWKPSDGEVAPKYEIEELMDNDGIIVGSNGIVFKRAWNEDGGENEDGKLIISGIVKENNSGDTLSNSTNVYFENKIGEPHDAHLEITKKVDESYTSDDAKVFKFKVKIIASDKFEYNGTPFDAGNYYLDSVKGLVKEADASDDKTYVSIEASKDKIGVWKSGLFRWIGDTKAPDYEVIEMDLPETKDIDESKEHKLENGNGSLVDVEGDSVRVVCTNGTDTKYGGLKIVKELDVDRSKLTEFQKEYIEKLANTLKFKYEVKYNGKTHTVELSKTDRIENTYTWEKTINDIPIDESNKKFTVKEVEVPAGTYFVKFDGSDSDVYEGTLEENEVVNVGNCHNKIDLFPSSLEITKKVDSSYDSDDSKTFKFTVKITATNEFYYNNEKHVPGVYYLDSEKGLVNEDTATISIQASKQSIGSWKSKEFEFDPEKTGPVYEVTEKDLNDGGANESKENKIENGSGVLKNGSVAKVVCINTSTQEEGSIKIIKIIDLDDPKYANYSDEQKEKMRKHIEGLAFTFDVTYNGATHELVLSNYKREGNKYTWEKTIEKIKITDNKEFTVKEKDVPKGTKFVRFDGSTSDVYIGSLKANEVANVTCYNEIEEVEDSGNLKIVKTITSDALKNEKFRFKVTISGTFNYKGKSYIKEDMVIDDIWLLEGNNFEYIFSDITWVKGMTAPTYKVEELNHDGTPLTTDDNGDVVVKDKEGGTIIAKQSSISNAGGSLSINSTTTVTATNDAADRFGYIKVIKEAENDAVIDDNEIFTFKVTITYADGHSVIYNPELSVGKTWISPKIMWKYGEDAPTYKVEEINIPEGYQLVELSNNSTGSVEDVSKNDDPIQAAIKVIATNRSEEHKGKFKIRKQIIAERKLLGDPKDLSFEVTYRIYGAKFKYKGEKRDEYTGSHTFKVTLDGDEYCAEFESEEVIWYGNDAPQVEVEEDLTRRIENLGWKNISISNNRQTLVDSESGDALIITVTNELPKFKKLLLTLDLSGTVWEDETKENKNDERNKNGKLDNVENGIPKVEVYILNSGDDSKAVLRDEMGAEITQPIYTDEKGNWTAKGITLDKIAYEKYKVEFLYDGQTYEPTTYLVSANVGNVSNPDQKKSDMYISDLNNSSLEDYPAMVAKYANDSVAIDKNRKEVNDRFKTIEGKEAINGSGITIGNAGGYDLTYKETNRDMNVNSSDKEDKGNNSLKSVIQTTDDNGYTLDQYKVTATTYKGMESAHAAYPLLSQVHLRSDSPSRELTVDGVKVTYKYVGYCKHINLGLVHRPDVDVSVVKVLDSATVVTKQNAQFFQFNKLADLIDKTKVERTLAPIGLYTSDYYYRSEIYTMSKDYDKIKEILGDSNGIEASEMQVYLKYKIQIVNNSAEYDVRINGIDDYSDSTLEVVESSFTQDVKTVNGKAENRKINIEKPYIVKGIGNSTSENISWSSTNIVEKDVLSSDGKYYDKYRVNLPDSPAPETNKDDIAKLSSGDLINIYVTYKTEKDSVESVMNAIKTGTKSNIVEIASYSTYYNSNSYNSNNGEYSGNAGKIDGNSAPSNLNMHDYNFRSFYEDDTYAAPVLELKLDEDQNKVVSGLAWEDKKKSEESVGDGMYDEDKEALIGGLTMELVETLSADGKDYDFLWPTNVGLNSFGGKSVEDIIGFDSTTESSRVNIDKDGKSVGANESPVVKVGDYSFRKIPVGDYFVKSEYGIDKSTLADTDQNTGAPTALNKDGEIFNSAKTRDDGNQISTEVLTANYDKDANSETPAVYNGQDYKATIFMNEDVNGYIYNDKNKDELVDIPEKTNDNKKKSYAIDDEVQRLEGMAKSTTITNELSELFNEANYVNGYHSKLYDDYAMSTYTRKVGICPVYNEDKSERKEEVKYINTGLIERPKNNIILDKEIKAIVIEIRKGDDNTKSKIFDAEFDTEYTIGDNKESDDKVLIKLPNSNNYLIAKTDLVEDKSVGNELMKAISRVEDKDQSFNSKRSDEGKYNNGIQNFRYIDIEDEILRNADIRIDYRFTALNVGEEDYTSERIAALDDVKSRETMYDVIDEARKDNIRGNEGKYLGSYYYDGQYDKDKNKTLRKVTTRVRQIVDYVDNDAAFDTEKNREVDHSWKNTSVLELAGNGLNGKQLLSKDIVATNKLLDKKDRVYITDSNNNVVLSVDEIGIIRNENGIDNYEQLTNALFEQQLVPVTDKLEKGTIETYNASEPAEGVGDTTANYAVLDLTITKSINSSEDVNDVAFDNIAEVVKLVNTVGRRDITIIQGNTNPKYGEFDQSVAERDTSSTELITFMPPNGLEDKEGKILSQALVAITAGLAIVGVGVVIIKKKVLTK